jgi:hypothetical protein
MPFSDSEITLARRLRDAGLPWEPSVGHYVYDEGELIEAPSPFHSRIYFILDLKHFLRRSGDIETLRNQMFWLPQWHQAREILRNLGMADQVIKDRLDTTSAIETQSELCCLFEMILESLPATSNHSVDPGIRQPG